MSQHRDLDVNARDVIDSNRYLVLGTLDPDGEARLSPVYYNHVDYADFYWVSSPEAHHSENIRRHPPITIVVFDSSALIGEGHCVYLRADASEVPAAELAEHCRAAFSGDLRGARAFAPDDLSGDADLRLYRAEAHSYEVHVRGRDPVHGTGIDKRMPADPRDREG